MAQSRLSMLPGVAAASVMHGGVPPSGYLSGAFFDNAIVDVDGATVPPGAEQRAVWFAAMPGFFDAMGMRLVRGRDVDRRDMQGAPPVAVVNEALARRLFGSADPIGKRIGFSPQVSMQIVGVVRARRFLAPRDTARLLVFVPYLQDPSLRFAHAETMFAIRTLDDPRLAADQIRSALIATDNRVPIERLATADQELSRALAEEKLIETCAILLAALAMALGCAGIYGVVSYGISQRTMEFGVRGALGASPADVLVMIVMEASRPVVAGAVAGTLLAVVAAKVVEARLYDISGHDAPTYFAAILIILAAGVLAALVPALRAARLAPATALRAE
jgi:putative ABC transport system permease protein